MYRMPDLPDKFQMITTRFAMAPLLGITVAYALPSAIIPAIYSQRAAREKSLASLNGAEQTDAQTLGCLSTILPVRKKGHILDAT
jgi:hypothetical protein